LSIDDFTQGHWEPVLKQVLARPQPHFMPPASSGAQDAATLLAPYLTKSGP
jgi:hypothetical protein